MTGFIREHLGIQALNKGQWTQLLTKKISYTNDFLQIKLASPQVIKKWSMTRFSNGISIGMVTSAETLHYKTLKPVFGGLFCERIFGPVKDWECNCGKTKRYRAPKRRTWCENCWVEITRSNKRRSKLGLISLSVPVLHPWYARSPKTINPLYRLLFLGTKDVKKILEEDFFLLSEDSLITPCTIAGSLFSHFEWRGILLFLCGRRFLFQDDFIAPWKKESEFISIPVNFLYVNLLANQSTYGLYTLLKRLNVYEFAKYSTKRIRLLRSTEFLLRKSQIIHFLALHNIGPIKKLDQLFRKVKKETRRTFKRKHLLLSGLALSRDSFLKNSRPEWIFISYLPVLPPDLRPILKVENGSFASSDLNDLYRFLLYRTIRLKKFVQEDLPHVIILKEISLVQSSVNAILDNASLQFPVKRTVMYEVLEPLRSLSDRIVGKTGRFRQNLLGKRVDYSGRSVIIVGPNLRLWECGLPHEMALVLFHSFLIYHLHRAKYVTSIGMAKKFIFSYPLTTIRILRKIIAQHPILLNRAPTLHRMGIQAFLPKLVNGRAIQLHPFVCPAFNADFDGDQMAVHIPLSTASILESRLLLLAPNNWLSPASGDPSLLPSQDIVLGIYYLTLSKKSSVEDNPTFFKKIHTLVWEKSFSKSSLKTTKEVQLSQNEKPEFSFLMKSGFSYNLYSSSIVLYDTFGNIYQSYFLTTVGRKLFHSYLPLDTL